MNSSATSDTGVWQPASVAELVERVRENFGGPRFRLCPVGGATSLSRSPLAERGIVAVEMSGLRSVIDYPHADQTITVQAGITIDELDRVLAEHHQRLPVDVPQSDRATLGGAIACNAAGPGRYGHGPLRDYVIGISAVDGQGRLFSAGGRVVKNVAGYDLCKLLIGSEGMLGAITQVSLKLRPRVPSRGLLCAAASTPAAIESALAILNTSQARPVALEVLNDQALSRMSGRCAEDHREAKFLLLTFVEGEPAECDWQLRAMRSELAGVAGLGLDDVADADHIDQWWRALTNAHLGDERDIVLRAGVPSSRVMEFIAAATEMKVAVHSHAGNGIVTGLLPPTSGGPAAATTILSQLRDLASRQGGNFRVVQSPAGNNSLAHLKDRNDPHQKWLTGIKQALDPAGVWAER